MRKRLSSLFTARAVPGWALFLWNFAERWERIEFIKEKTQHLWGFAVSPAGQVVITIVGVIWLTIVMMSPEIKRWYSGRKPLQLTKDFGITEPIGGHLVEMTQTVYGIGPIDSTIIEAWVWAGRNNKYYRQGRAIRVSDHEWRLRCTFGEVGKPGGSYKIFGVLGSSTIQSPSDHLPDGPKTEGVLVYREF